MGRNILVVDDNAMVRESYAVFCLKKKYTVEQAGDGEQALDVVGAKEIDLAIVDVMMPNMGGLELRQHLLRQSPSVATILVTGQPDRVEGLMEDDADFLSGRISILYKPVHPVKLLAEVDKHLS